jgi:hypothetical protein
VEIPEDHPDRNKYFSMTFRKKHMNSSDVEELTLMDRRGFPVHAWCLRRQR